MFWNRKKKQSDQQIAQKHLAMIGTLYLQAVETDRNLRRSAQRNGVYYQTQLLIANYGEETTPNKNI